jgi:hypothetical protein
MQLSPCSPANSILEGDLDLAVQQQTLKKLKVMETPEGFFVIAQLKWAGNKEWYLTTRRERTKPKLFKDLKRLNDHLKEAYPTDSFELHRNQTVPARGDHKAPVDEQFTSEKDQPEPLENARKRTTK